MSVEINIDFLDENESPKDDHELDLVTIKLSIIQSKRDLESILNKLYAKEETYKDFASKTAFVNLQLKFDKLDVSLEESIEQFNDLKSQIENLNAQQIQLVKEREELKTLVSKTRRSLTPRPDWKSYSVYLSDQKFKLSNDLKSQIISTEQKLDIISRLLSTKNDKIEFIKAENLMKNSFLKFLKNQDLSKIKKIRFADRDFF